MLSAALGVARERQAVVEVAANEQRPRAIRERLRELSERHLADRDKHERAKIRLRRIGRERRRRVPGRRTRDRLRANALRLRHRDGHAAILERARRIVSLVLHEQTLNTGPLGYRMALEQRRVAFGMRDDDVIGRRRQDELAIAPDARRVRPAQLLTARGEAQRAARSRRTARHE